MKSTQILVAIFFLACAGIAQSGDLPEGWLSFKKSPDSEIDAGTDNEIFYSAPTSITNHKKG